MYYKSMIHPPVGPEYDEMINFIEDIENFILTRHSNNHRGTIFTCKDDVCDFYARYRDR